jgi:hypothetical protein
MSEEKANVTWSHSALKSFEQCARQYHEVKVLKKHPFRDTPQTLYGKDVHKAIEDYGREGTPIPDAYAQFNDVVDAIMRKPGRKLYEHEMGLRADMTPCGFNDSDRWVRGIADMLIINDDNLTARVVDWKTGSDKYPDRDQLVLMSLMVFAHFPHIREVKSALVFLVKGSMTTHSMSRDDIEPAWWQYKERVAKLEAAYDTGVWNPKQSPLCGWCPCTNCPFNPKH